MNFFKNDTLIKVFGDPIQLVILFLIATVLGMAIAMTYKKTHRGFSYSQSFSFTVVLITVITTLIILLIEDSIARALGIFGAFSIIRFRTAIKDVRDIAFIFFSLATGLAVGVGSVGVGITGVIFICALIFLLHHTNFGGMRRLEYVLNFKLDAKNHSNEVFKEVMKNHLKKEMLLNVDSKLKGAFLVFTFNISLKNSEGLNDFVSEMNKIDGVSEVNLVSSKNDLEL